MEYLFGGTVLRKGVGIIDTVDEPQRQGFVGTKPVLLAIEIQRADFLLLLTHAGGIHLAKGILQRLDLADASLHFLLVAVTASLNTVEHQTGITAHLHRLAAKGNHRGHAGGNAVNVDRDVGLAVFQGVENGDARIHLAAVAVDTHVNLTGQGLGLQKFAGDITAAHIVVIITDVAVKKDTAGVFPGYDVEKLFHAYIVF